MIPGSVRIFICRLPQDMRRSFDGLALAIEETLGDDPRSGAVYCFINKRANRLKLIWWHRNGYCILYKRVHEAAFELPEPPRGRLAIPIDGPALATLVAGKKKVRRRKKA